MVSTAVGSPPPDSTELIGIPVLALTVSTWPPLLPNSGGPVVMVSVGGDVPVGERQINHVYSRW